MENSSLIWLICLSVAIADGLTYSMPIIASVIDFPYPIVRYICLTVYTGSLFLGCLIYNFMKDWSSVRAFQFTLLSLAISLLLGTLVPLSIGIFCGLTSGLVFYSGLMISLLDFSNPALITGIYTAASSIGAIIVPLLVTYGLKVLEWRGVLTIMTLLLMIGGLIPFKSRKKEVAVTVSEGSWYIKGLISLLIFNLVSHLTFFIPFIFIYDHLVKTQHYFSPYYISFLSIFQVPGRLLSGIVVERNWITAMILNTVGTIMLVISFILCYIDDSLIIPSSIFMSLALSIISSTMGLTVNHVATGNKVHKSMIFLTLARGTGVMISTLFGSLIGSLDIIYILSIGASIISLLAILYPTMKHPHSYAIVDTTDDSQINVSFSKSRIVRNTSEHSVAYDNTKSTIRV